MITLEDILRAKRLEVEERRLTVPLHEMKDRAAAGPLPRGFRRALTNRTAPLGLIAEIKKASPSHGLIREEFDPVDIAQEYENAGANCLSVLTDEKFFQGSMENLVRCREAVSLPVLRKDFVIDEYQVFESRAAGADAVLLIAAGMGNSELGDLYRLARETGMDVLVEVHDQSELRAALALGADIIGVNNRNLRNLKTSISVSLELMPLIGEGVLVVSESGIQSRDDTKRLEVAGADAVLVGAAFCGSANIGAKVREVMGW